MSNYEFTKTMEPYYLTPPELIPFKIELLNLKDGDIVFDLGSGDARQLIHACSIANITCIGYELLPEAINDAEKNIQKSGLSEHIEIKAESYYDADISNATAVVLYLTRTVLGALSLKLENELPKGARIVTHQFDIPAWEAEKVIDIILSDGSTEKIYLYRKK